MSDKLIKFTGLMKAIFELDKSDLDFGIYRIMNIRKTEIEKFLSEGLPQKVKETLESFSSNTDEINARIAEIEKTCESVGVEVSASKMADEYDKLKSQLISGIDMSALETDVYSALFSFFNRYYDEGDFISKRRYKEGVYAIPYEGEEVKLYWANQDQYYIKTSENFKDYIFKDGEQVVHFRLIDATMELNNNKENSNSKRVFMLYEENEERPDIKTFEQNDNELIIRFVFDVPADKKRKYAEENAQKISNEIVKTYKGFLGLLRNVSSDPKKPKTLIEKHLDAYVAKNTFDYFIHKDLRGFLTRELDFYIKSEIIHLDDLDTTNEKRVETYLAKVKAIKRVGKIIIDFLAQIENFQKKLWLKKKFVVETNWCITLDKVDESYYQDIINNKDQLQEWINMYSINEIDGYTEPLSVDFLRQNLNLIIDTKHFTQGFKDSLIASVDDLDEQTNGLLIHGDNYQALNLIKERYEKKLNGIYIDPPYNTDGMEIIYKNGYKDSSWITLMADRLELGNVLLKDDAVECVMIDDAEYANLFKLMSQQMPTYSIRPVIIEYNHRGRVKSNFAYTHEYAVWAIPEGKDLITRKREVSDDIRRNLRRTGTDSTRQSSPSMFYGIEVDTKSLKIVGITEPLPIDDVIPKHTNKKTTMIWPIDDNGIERRWYYGKARIMDDVENGTVWAKIISGKIQIHYHQDGKPKYRKTLLNGSLMDSSTYGSELLNDIFGMGASAFSFPKSIHAVEECINSMTYSNDACFLDYFAGSGTTAHAVININRSDEESKRKYILIEMGEYFNIVTLPRVKKVVYSSEWNNGKPKNRNSGVSQIIKYFRLESYEDALSNIEFNENAGQLQSLFGENYLINYMMDVETEGSLLKIDCFKSPFEYKLNIVEKNESLIKKIDLVETFNYLLGLRVMKQSIISYFNAIENENGNYEGAVTLKQDSSGMYGFKMIEGTLADGQKALIIWRTISDNLIESNAALDAYFSEKSLKTVSNQFDVIYVNGDSNLENLKSDKENWKVRMIEIEFKNRMFEGV
ncbi:DNA methyltransferase [Fusibacter bizertensis]|uniref:DNA methyltransferase n=1 Tax=Fusibacter bizertensis TaxID=1488331 RepID=A0ABT6NE27_9FIRM|nr:DNA methyltransferase [Fusibacter bizertensis]MDH8678658.1 DNA methyltransferase [Fusibacter bizertensis]